MIMVILQPTVPTEIYTAPTSDRVGTDGGTHSGSTDTTAIMALTIPIFGVGIGPDLEEGDIPVKQLSLKGS